jgi:hypothetical protein
VKVHLSRHDARRHGLGWDFRESVEISYGEEHEESSHRNAYDIPYRYALQTFLTAFSYDPASSHGSENGSTAEQDDPAVGIMADQPRYSLQHVNPSLLAGLLEALCHIANLTKSRLY